MTISQFAGDKVTLRLRASIITLDIVALGFLSNAIYQHQHYFYTDGNGPFIDSLSLAPVLLSLIWTAISFIIRYSKGAYHPGVDVGLELCSWLLVVGTVWYLIFWIYAIGYYSNVSCSAPHREDCTHARGAVLLASEIIAALSILVFGLLHFILFIKACRATHLRRVLEREARSGADEPRELAENIVIVARSKRDMA